MLAPYQILLPLLSLFLVRVDLTDLFPLTYPVKVERILDGDTLEVRLGSRLLRVRLNKVDAPESKQPFILTNASAGEVSKACLKKILQNRFYELKIQKQDIYGRTLGDLEDLNFQVVQQGCSGLYPHAEFASKREKFLYLKMQSLARMHRLGVWAYGGYQTPKVWRKLSKRSAHPRWRRGRRS